eukprot:Skav213039  [mRNA]  locus=scaffold844:687737:688207:+ [translate_table: standard]
MRVVVQQVAAGSPCAGKFGLSSATPFAEAVRVYLQWAHRARWVLPHWTYRQRSCTQGCPKVNESLFGCPQYVPVYADLDRALNGLRSASRAWLNLVREEACKHGLHVCPTESTVFKGTFVDGDASMWMAIPCYVDDLLVISPDARAPQYVQKKLER